VGRKIFSVIATGLILGSFAAGQTPPEKKLQAPAVQPANELAEALAQRLSNDLHVKTAVGDPIKVGSVTLIPILMIQIGFGGGGVAMPGGSTAAAPANPAPGIDGFYMSGEARPLGFVAVTRKGTRFISIGKAPAK
jgi:uncharacterized spore protein YtfJ